MIFMIIISIFLILLNLKGIHAMLFVHIEQRRFNVEQSRDNINPITIAMIFTVFAFLAWYWIRLAIFFDGWLIVYACFNVFMSIYGFFKTMSHVGGKEFNQNPLYYFLAPANIAVIIYYIVLVVA